MICASRAFIVFLNQSKYFIIKIDLPPSPLPHPLYSFPPAFVALFMRQFFASFLYVYELVRTLLYALFYALHLSFLSAFPFCGVRPSFPTEPALHEVHNSIKN